MKKHFFMTVVIFLLLCSGLTARTIGNSAVSSGISAIATTDSVPFAYSEADIDTPAEYVGGKEFLKDYLKLKTRFPDVCKASEENPKAIEGNVGVRFIVGTDGYVDYADVVSSPHPALSREALRVIKGLPPFRPGVKDGKTVPTWQEETVKFETKDKIYVPIDNDTTHVFAVVDGPASFPGGEQTLLTLIGKNIRYPAKSLEHNVQGVVLLRFVVLEDGSVGKIRIVRGISPLCDREAVRVVKNLPRFIPGTQKGKAVKTYFNLPIRFQIQ